MNNFERACILSNDDWVDSLPDIIEPYKFSKQHNRKMQKLFSKMRKDKYHKYTKNTTRALIIAALISSMTITAFAIPQSREFIIKKLFNHSSYTIKDVSNVDIVVNLTVEYIPEGFELTNNFESDNLFYCEYEYLNKYLIISKYTLDNKVDFDTEMYEYKKVIKDNLTYVLYRSQTGGTGIIWNKNDYIYSIKGNISDEILLEIALKTK